MCLDSELIMRPHIARTASTSFFHLRRLRQLRRFADQSTMQRFVSAFVIARLDYCHSVMAGLPASSLAPLIHVLSAAVRLVAGLGPRDHVTEHMKRLHWLPIQFRIKFKLCVLMHGEVHGQSLSYIKDVLVPLIDLLGHSRLRSADAGQYDVPFTRAQFGCRGLSVAAPTEWNNLPANLRSIADITAFKKAIKLHFGRQVYS